MKHDIPHPAHLRPRHIWIPRHEFRRAVVDLRYRFANNLDVANDRILTASIALVARVIASTMWSR
jgi:hypothetical protein